jgi:hypothetical protein
MIRILIHVFIFAFWLWMVFALVQKQSYLKREHFSRQDLQEVPLLQIEKADVFYGNKRLAVFEMSTSIKKLGRTPTELSYLRFRLGLYLRSEKIDIIGKGYVLTHLEGEPLRVRVEIKANGENFLMIGNPEKEKFTFKVFHGREKKVALSIPYADLIERLFFMVPDLSSEKAVILFESLGFKIRKLENTEELNSYILEYPSMDLLTEGWNRGSKEH